VINANPSSLYQLHGGAYIPPSAFAWAGIWQNYLHMNNPPENGGSILSVGSCSTTGCGDPNAFYNIFSGIGGAGNVYPTIAYRPKINQMSINIRA
jgi:hypothetical protein